MRNAPSGRVGGRGLRAQEGVGCAVGEEILGRAADGGSGFGGMGRSAGDAGKAWKSVTGGAPRRPRSGRPKAPRRTRSRTARTRAAETAPENVLLMLEPACVASCPQHAIEFGDIEELRRKHGTCAAIAPLPAAEATKTALVIHPGKTAKKVGDASGAVHFALK